MTVWTVTPNKDDSRQGRLTGPLVDMPCALGKHGVVLEADGREGDGKTPAGTYPLRRIFYRPDRQQVPITDLPVLPLSPELGWCDAPGSPHYNKLVRLPFGASHERMWRDDPLYDLVLVLGHNDDPVVPGMGSAIFLHVARDGYTPTMGCVALQVDDMCRFLRQIGPNDYVKILQTC